MSAGTTAELGRVRGTSTGLVWLVALLIGVLGLTAAFTSYLFRTISRPVLLMPAASPPGSFAVALIRGPDLFVQEDGRSRRLATLPQPVVIGLSAIAPSADGSHLLIVSATGRGDRLWMLSLPAGEVRAVALPPTSSGGWRYVSSRWTSGGRATVILASGAQAGAALVVARIDPAGLLQALFPWVAPSDGRTGPSRVASLSSTGGQVALVERLTGGGGFQPQVIVKLQHLATLRASIAYRYLGDALPSAVLWSPDDGTVAIAAPGAGLAIRKASGRPVRLVSDGALPGAFSAGIARFCYLTGHTISQWQFHVLDLHSEADSLAGAALQGRPDWVAWTPDGRAILYTLGGRLWQLDLGAGVARPLGPAAGTPVAVEASR